MDDYNAHPPFLLDILHQYASHSLAWSCLQPRMRFFGEANIGLIPYRTWMGQCVVLGDPLCAPDQMQVLLEPFLQQHRNALFMQIHHRTAVLLKTRGYHATPVGVENEIDTATFELSGKRKRDLRHYRNKARQGIVTVSEETDCRPLREELDAVSDAWLPMKSWFSRELEFLARPFQLEPEPEVRVFVGRIAGRAGAFTILDPMYGSGRILGYTVTILRHCPDAPEGAVDAINLFAIERLRAEGVPVLSLGISPFYHMPEQAAREGRGKPAPYWLYRALYHWGGPIYHFKGLSFHKSRYRAREVPMFTAIRAPLGLLPLYASARVCKML